LLSVLRLEINVYLVVDKTECRSQWPFARSKDVIVGSNPTQGIDVYVCLFCVYVLSCMQIAALRRANPSTKESYRLCKKIKKLKKRTRPYKER
jgi:hypothetical protein